MKRRLSRKKPLAYSRLAYFTRKGFTLEEAEWAVKNGIGPRSKEVPEIVERRRKHIETFIEEFGVSRTEVIRRACELRKSRIPSGKKGIEGEDNNLFYELS